MSNPRHRVLRVRAGLKTVTELRQQEGAERKLPTMSAPTVPRIARLLALAHRWQQLIEEGEIKDQAEIPRLAGLTPARVSQVFQLQYLPPALQTRLLFATATALPLSARSARQIAGAVYWNDYHTRRALSPTCGPGDRGRTVGSDSTSA